MQGCAVMLMCVCAPCCYCIYMNVACHCACWIQKVWYTVKSGYILDIPGLLFADDTPLLAPDESRIKKSLEVLVEWCEEWGVKINVSKS